MLLAEVNETHSAVSTAKTPCDRVLKRIDQVRECPPIRVESFANAFPRFDRDALRTNCLRSVLIESRGRVQHRPQPHAGSPTEDAPATSDRSAPRVTSQ